jgi:hypothetical protein
LKALGRELPLLFSLKVLQALDLLGVQPTEHLAPPIIRHLHHGLALRRQNIDLPQLRDDLFRFRFLAITVLLDVKDRLQVGPLEWERIISD